MTCVLLHDCEPQEVTATLLDTLKFHVSAAGDGGGAAGAYATSWLLSILRAALHMSAAKARVAFVSHALQFRSPSKPLLGEEDKRCIATDGLALYVLTALVQLVSSYVVQDGSGISCGSETGTSAPIREVRRAVMAPQERCEVHAPVPRVPSTHRISWVVYDLKMHGPGAMGATLLDIDFLASPCRRICPWPILLVAWFSALDGGPMPFAPLQALFVHMRAAYDFCAEAEWRLHLMRNMSPSVKPHRAQWRWADALAVLRASPLTLISMCKQVWPSTDHYHELSTAFWEAVKSSIPRRPDPAAPRVCPLFVQRQEYELGNEAIRHFNLPESEISALRLAEWVDSAVGIPHRSLLAFRPDVK